MRRLWNRLLCKLIGHKWFLITYRELAWTLINRPPVIPEHDINWICKRCGKTCKTITLDKWWQRGYLNLNDGSMKISIDYKLIKWRWL